MNKYKHQLLTQNKIFLCINITQRCNLNCRYCNAFANLTKYTKDLLLDYDYNQFEKDIEHIKKTCNIGSISFYGSEFFVNKNWKKFIVKTRELFNCQIDLFTNGIKLVNLKDYNILIDNNIKIVYTKYPLNEPLKTNIDNAVKFLKSKGLDISLPYDPEKINPTISLKTLFTVPRFYKTRYSAITAHKLCACDAISMFNGKIFTCNINNNINILNNVYNYNYKQNYILVENIKSNLDLIKFSKMHSELCQYCYQTEKISNTSIQREWSLEIPSKNDYG